MSDGAGVEPEVEPEVSHLWDCVKGVLATTCNPRDKGLPFTPNSISHEAAERLGRELAATTVEDWFKKWSVVPVEWEKFETLLMVLDVEHVHDWEMLYKAARLGKKRRQQLQAARRQLETEREQHEQLRRQLETKRGQHEQLRWKLPILISVSVVVVAVVVTLWRILPGSPPSPRDVLCTRVSVAQAEVLSEDHAQLIKKKSYNDPIRVLPGIDSARGWVAVLTPGVDPGYNFMRRGDLGEFSSCAE